MGIGVVVRQLAGVRLGCFYQHSAQPPSITRIKSTENLKGVPRISLVTPSFNQAQFLGKAIDSVLAQQYPDLEYCVQDAASTDGSGELLNRYKDQGVCVRIERDAGQADGLNRGFANTTGEVMGYLNSDDLLLPGALPLVGALFRDHSEIDVIYGNRIIIDEQGLEVGRWVLPGHDQILLSSVDYIPQESMFWRRRIWDSVGAHFNVSMQFALDWELLLRFADAGAVFMHAPELFGIFRVHGAQKSQANFFTQGAKEIEDLKSRYENKTASPWTRVLRHLRYLRAHRLADRRFRDRY
jgi:glycosyltransferase involved in cell wall biosynthesis